MRLWTGCGFLYGTYSGDVRDWCAESRQVLGFVRKRQLDGKRNPPKRRQISHRRRSGLDHARVEDDRVSPGALRRTGSDPRWTLLPGPRGRRQPVSEGGLRRYWLSPARIRAALNTPDPYAVGSGWPAGA